MKEEENLSQKNKKRLESRIDLECNRIRNEAHLKYAGDYKIKKFREWRNAFSQVMRSVEVVCMEHNLDQVPYLGRMRKILGFELYTNLIGLYYQGRSHKKD